MNGISELLSRLREEGKLVGTISAAKKRHADRQRIDRTPAKVRRKPKTEIPLSYDIACVARARARSEMPRIRKWLGPAPSTRRGGIFCTREQEGTYAGRKKYAFFANRIALTSYGYAFGELTQRQQHLLCDPQTSGGLLVAVTELGADEFEAAMLAEGLQLQALGQLRAPQTDKPLIEVV